MAMFVVNPQPLVAKTRQLGPRATSSSGWNGPALWILEAALLTALLIAGTTAWAAPWLIDQQHVTTLQVAREQQQEGELQAYLDRMSDLLLTQHLATSHQGDAVREVARVRTLAVLGDLNARRKGIVLRFLYEAGLISGQSQQIIDLGGADLSGVDLSSLRSVPSNDPRGPNLLGVNLDRTNLGGANFSRADLSAGLLNWADLEGANLSGAILVGAHLYGTNLSGADLSGADLGGAHLIKTNLSGAHLVAARLNGTDLTGSQLNHANLSAADIDGATLTGTILTDTIMPDGSTHP